MIAKPLENILLNTVKKSGHIWKTSIYSIHKSNKTFQKKEQKNMMRTLAVQHGSVSAVTCCGMTSN